MPDPTGDGFISGLNASGRVESPPPSGSKRVAANGVIAARFWLMKPCKCLFRSPIRQTYRLAFASLLSLKLPGEVEVLGESKGQESVPERLADPPSLSKSIFLLFYFQSRAPSQLLAKQHELLNK